MSDSSSLRHDATQPDGTQPVKKVSRQGETQVGKSSGETEKQPRGPTERDESSDSQASRTADQAEVGKAAYKDAAGPQQDTDRSAVTDKVYNEEVVPPDSRK